MKSRIKSLAYALSGIAFAFRSQVNMRIHVTIALVVLIASVLFRIAPLEWCIVLFCISSVIAAELINTSIEMNVDLVSPGRNEKAGQIKDLAAAAVLVVCIISALIGSIVFIPKIIHLL